MPTRILSFLEMLMTSFSIYVVNSDGISPNSLQWMAATICKFDRGGLPRENDLRRKGSETRNEWVKVTFGYLKELKEVNGWTISRSSIKPNHYHPLLHPLVNQMALLMGFRRPRRPGQANSARSTIFCMILYDDDGRPLLVYLGYLYIFTRKYTY